jgi:2-polyprenyl-3-methyl-5-hydroxy-6-metoxy-1,4-benzoquinol methylase
MQCGICQSQVITNPKEVKDHSISKEIFIVGTCESCGLVYTHDAPQADKIGPYYASQDYISHSDTRKGFISLAYHKVRSYMLGRKGDLVANYHSTGSLLDVGCGTGYFAKFMMDRGYEVIGVEIDDNARNHGIQKFGITAHNVDFIEHYNGEKFDVITLWHVLEHIYDLGTYMQTFHSMLNNGGHLFIAVPNNRSLDAEVFEDFWAAYDVPRHLWHFDVVSMSKLASKFNFDIIHKEQMPFDPFYNSMLSAGYKGSFSKLLTGFSVGLRAYFRGKRDVNKASSIIYVMSKK